MRIKAKAMLSVPFEEKDEAKNAGARWDPLSKQWYCPVGVSLQPLMKWVPKEAVKKDPKEQARLRERGRITFHDHELTPEQRAHLREIR